jgi:general stress protein 26
MTRRTSRKALEIGRAGRLTVVFQHDADDSYVTLIGRSEIITDRAVIRPRWQKDWNLFFADGAEDENAVLVRTEAMRLELWVRGVTAEPFGARTTILERDESREWREVPR